MVESLFGLPESTHVDMIKNWGLFLQITLQGITEFVAFEHVPFWKKVSFDKLDLQYADT